MSMSIKEKIKFKIWRILFPENQVYQINDKYFKEFMEKSKVIIDSSIKGNEWSDFMEEIYDNFLTKDKNSFLRFPIVQNTLHPAHYSLSSKYFNFLKDKDIYLKYLSKCSVESPVGNPFADLNYKLSSPLLIQHAHHLYTILTSFNIKIDHLESIFEYGAGYGSFSRLLKNSGFRNTHIIYDLEFMTLLQKMYLKSVFNDGVNKNIGNLDNINWISRIEDVLRLDIENKENSLFIATWSLSETPLDVRDKFIPIIKKHKYIFITYQRDFYETDNVSYFKNFKSEIDTHKWNHYECKFFKNNFYLIGTKK